jgi:hypothetical protein
MAQEWVCSENPEHVFDSIGDGFCPQGDGGVLVPYEGMVVSSDIGEEGLVEYQGEDGLGILVFDLSGSMSTSLDPDSDSPVSKIAAVANAFGTTIASLVHGGGETIALKHPEGYFVALIGFADDAELLGIYKLANMGKGDYESTLNYWKQYTLDAFKKFGNRTNITKALEIALEIYQRALDGELTSHYSKQFPDLGRFELGSQNVVVDPHPLPMPNVRVLVYSDGVHNVGDFHNRFAGVSLVPDVSSETGRMVNGLLSIYFGPPQKEGAKQMKEIAGFCPVHGTVGTIPITKLAHYKYLRNLLHLSSQASGFCIECAKDIRG